ncbi:hypothetical protein [Micromonospora sp. Llam0]|uniref:hypothetical protein n=1 Tax=Micromonospora sp. Llam0 TaxID=2485143 RepID=UPI0018F75D8A|nr:hypothetical protein [Micromonospora sp. Llam0]
MVRTIVTKDHTAGRVLVTVIERTFDRRHPRRLPTAGGPDHTRTAPPEALRLPPPRTHGYAGQHLRHLCWWRRQTEGLTLAIRDTSIGLYDVDIFRNPAHGVKATISLSHSDNRAISSEEAVPNGC